MWLLSLTVTIHVWIQEKRLVYVYLKYPGFSEIRPHRVAWTIQSAEQKGTLTGASEQVVDTQVIPEVRLTSSWTAWSVTQTLRREWRRTASWVTEKMAWTQPAENEHAKNRLQLHRECSQPKIDDPNYHTPRQHDKFPSLANHCMLSISSLT